MSEQLALYAQIQQYMKQQIVFGEWVPHAQIPAERTLAERFGVSRITAKNAILGLVTEKLLYRQQGRGTFVAAHAPSILKREGRASEPKAGALHHSGNDDALAATGQTTGPRTKPLIGLVMPLMEHLYAARFISGVEAELSRRDCHLLFKRIEPHPVHEPTAIRDMLELAIDGLIVVAPRGALFHDDLIRLILDKFPLVFVEKYVSDYQANRVYCDTERGGYLMGEYLARRAAGPIGLVAYPFDYTEGVKERVFGFQSALVENAVPPVAGERYLNVGPELIEGGSYSSRADRVPDAILDYLRSNSDLAGVATADAQLMQYVSRGLRLLGMDNTVLVGFDEPGFVPDGCMPAAYIDQSPTEMGVHAATLIADAIGGETAIRHVALTPRLVEIEALADH
ncbi:GntR family transcriptional regulator [Paenibacillus sp. IB182496]|uniref:GntR family transcriptional regulator n=1 Tax=Paenibacillus sabuli TaxID=2772509 RepID=A0A927BQB7_9BACL|nr:GntR family transcriptional regulator [Paenibacillus sabuli]MBD2843563.1 GntR family transcriptional regulator [Paenibacillus sabuli]